MLVHLSIRELAIIDRLELSLLPGMTVLTGETGAGKSILVDAISLLLGARARAELVRTGSDEAEVSGQFLLQPLDVERLEVRLDEHGLPPCEDSSLVVRRIISRHGRHKQFVNGALATVSQVRALMEPLIDITGQHAHQALMRPLAQMELLDAFGMHQAQRSLVAKLHHEAKALVQERDSLQGSEEEKIRQAEYLRFQLDELDALAPQPGEDEELAIERARLHNAGRLQEVCAQCLEALVEGGDDALSRVQAAAHRLARAGEHLPEYARWAEMLEEAATLIDEVARSLSRHGGGDEDPVRLAEVDDRLDALKRVMRKHGGSIETVIDAQTKMAEELSAIEHAEERLEEIDAELEKRTEALAAACRTLTDQRHRAGRELAVRVEEELKDLGMPKARFEVAVEAISANDDTPLSYGVGESRRALQSHGSDRVEMRLAANPGEAGAALAKAASGGELSRIMLAIKRVLLERDPIPVTIFDEVDSGVGGAVGEAIGDKLRAIASGRQVLVITHLAQIAAQAHQQLRVEKVVVDGRTSSRIYTLAPQERVEELARMIGGRELTETTKQHAAEMLGLLGAAGDTESANQSSAL